MLGTKDGKRYAVPFRIKPERGQLPENSVHPETKQAWCVFHDCETGSKFANNSAVFFPKAASFTIEASAFSCDRNILAGEPSGNDVNRSNCIGFQLPNIFKNRHIGPVFIENPLAERVNLAEGHCLKPARPLKAEGKPADAGKQIKDFEFLHVTAR